MLPAVDIDAGVASVPVENLSLPAWWPQALAAVALVALLLALSRIKRGGDNPLRAAHKALRQGDARAASRALYRWLNRRPGQPGWLSLREYSSRVDLADSAEQLLSAAYGRQPGPAPDARLARELEQAQQRPDAQATNPLNPL